MATVATMTVVVVSGLLLEPLAIAYNGESRSLKSDALAKTPVSSPLAVFVNGICWSLCAG
jgi:hypothetical protein